MVLFFISIFSLFFIQKVEASDLSLEVVPQIGSVNIDQFPGGELTVVIEKGGVEHTFNFDTMESGRVELWSPMLEFLQIEPGDTVTITVGEDSISHEVLGNLAVTNINYAEDSVTGISNTEGVGAIDGETFQEGSVYVAVFDSGTLIEEMVVASDPGGWIAEFTEGVVTLGRSIMVSQTDNTGGQTIYMDAESLQKVVRNLIIDSISSFGNIQSNIQDILLDYPESYANLYFYVSNQGRITFDEADIEGLLSADFSLFSKLGQAEDLIQISFDEENNRISVSVSTGDFTFLEGFSATIEFMKVAERLGIDNLTEENIREHLDIFVFDDGERITDTSKYFDWNNISYDPLTDILSLPVNHFTEYVLGELDIQEEGEEESEELTETGIGIITITSLSTVSLLAYTIFKKKEK